MYTTFKVDELRDQCSNLEETYMKKREAPVSLCPKDLQKISLI